ncbi:MAG: ABC transporter substrate-binding protein [Myxococcaceae bacterium]|nr:ABC transporter substrate-binding protein [Myxococcaceae bacterium]
MGILAAAALLGCSCDKPAVVDAGVVDAGPKVLAEKEPNNGPETALAIDGNVLVEANLGADPAKPDEDWYVLTANAPKTVDVVVSCPAGSDIMIELADAARTPLALVNSAPVGEPERFVNLDVASKTYFRVLGAKKGAGGAYTVTTTYRDRDPGFELEPNDRRVDASPVAMGQAVSGFIAHMGDSDWHRFELPGREGEAPSAVVEDAGEADAGVTADASVVLADAGMLDGGAADAGVEKVTMVPIRIDLSAVDGVRFELQVLSEAEAVLFEAKGKEGGPLSLRNVGIRQTDRVIYVVVKSAPLGTAKDAKRGFNADAYYTLTVAPEEAGASAEIEPNDKADKATSLAANSYREGFLSPKGDVDYYRLITDGPSLAKVSVSGVEKVDLQLSLIQEGSEPEVTLLKVNDGVVKEPESLNNVSCSGSCLFRVEAAPRKVDGKMVKDDENSDMAYRISAVVVPDDGSEEREPNNTVDKATPVEANKPVRGTIFPKKDVDYFKLDLSKRAVKTPIKATVTGILKVDLGLYLHRVDEEGKLELVQTADKAKGEKSETVQYSAEPGVYVLEVRDAKNREANFQDAYQLTVEEESE